MRTVHWLFVVSVALFVSGIGFVIAGGRTTQVETPVDVLPVTTPVASIKQIMAGITGPNATVVYNAVSYIITADGAQENFPQNDEEWTVIANSAAALVESGNLLLMGDRAVDNGEWGHDHAGAYRRGDDRHRSGRGPGRRRHSGHRCGHQCDVRRLS